MSLRRASIVLIATTVTALGFWLGRDVEQRLEVFISPAPDTPELYMEHFTLTVTGTDGLPRHSIRGERMEQYQLDGSSLVETPVMVMNQPDAPDWTLNAEQAWVSPDGEEVRLHGAVHMSRPEGPAHAPVDIHTRDVTVWPEPQRAESEAPVQVRSPHYQVDGTGLRANLQTSILELLHDTDATYFP
jgi:lipopolysaccharide export system protein LptC